MFNVEPFLAQFSCDLSFAIWIFFLFDIFVTLFVGLWLKLRQNKENELGMKSKHDMFQM